MTEMTPSRKYARENVRDNVRESKRLSKRLSERLSERLSSVLQLEGTVVCIVVETTTGWTALEREGNIDGTHRWNAYVL